MQVGKSENVKATLTPSKATNKNIEWSSSDESVATVSKGKVYGVAEGETVITAKAADGNGASADLKVTVVIPVKKITVQDKAVILAEDTTWKLDYIVEPTEATMNAIEWTSSNDNVASIDENGLITGHKIGKCEVIGTAKDGSKVKVKVKVQVKDFDYVLRKPGNLQTDLNLSNEYLTSEVSFPGFHSKSVYERHVSYGNNVVGDAGSNQIRPLKAGEGTIECVGKDNGRVTEKWKKTVYVAQSAAPIESDDEIGRMEAESYEGHTYQVFYSSRSWDDAEAFCEKHGGHLATITGEKEQKFLERYLAKAEKKQSYWIGLNSGKTKGFSKWITGEPITYTKWSEGNPDGNESSHNCARIAASEYADENNWTMKRGTWDDVGGNYYQINGFICEWDEDNSPNVLPGFVKTADDNTAVDSTEAETSIVIKSGEESRYGQKLILNEGKDTEITIIGYFLPTGTYEVLNQGKDKAIKVFLYENVKQIINGSEEYKESANGKPLMLLPGKSGEITIGDNEFVLPSTEEFSLLFERLKTVSLKDMGVPEDAEVNDGHAYKVFDFTATWNDAKNKCESLGGHLATITSQDEQQFIEELTRNMGELWIGMYRVDDDSFAWVTGEPVSYTNWGAGEPNNYWTWEFDGENAVAMRPDWNDYHENNTEQIKGFVCEWDLTDAKTEKVIGESEGPNSFDDVNFLKDAVIPEDAEIYNGHAYKSFDIPLSWNEAETYCEGLGGHLATIGSMDENDFLFNLVSEKNVYWIGMKLDDTKRCRWITGEDVNFMNFLPGEPDNNLGNQGYCILLAKDAFGMTAGKWADLEQSGVSWDGEPFWSERGFFCEWDSIGMSGENNAASDDLDTSADSGHDESEELVNSALNKPVVPDVQSIEWGSKSLNEAEIDAIALSGFLGDPMLLNVRQDDGGIDGINARSIYIENKNLNCDLAVVIRISEEQVYMWSLDLNPENLVKAQLVFDEDAPFCSIARYGNNNQLVDSAYYIDDLRSLHSYAEFEYEVKRIISSLSTGTITTGTGLVDPILSVFHGIEWGMSKNEVKNMCHEIIVDDGSEGFKGIADKEIIFDEDVEVMFLFTDDKLSMITIIHSQENTNRYIEELKKAYGDPLQTTWMETTMAKFSSMKEDPDGDVYAWTTDKSLIVLHIKDSGMLEYKPLY